MVNMEVYSWDTSFGHVNLRLRSPCDLVEFRVNLGTFFLSASCSWDGGPWASASINPSQTGLHCFALSLLPRVQDKHAPLRQAALAALVALYVTSDVSRAALVVHLAALPTVAEQVQPSPAPD
jgi:hypothetical protein